MTPFNTPRWSGRPPPGGRGGRPPHGGGGRRPPQPPDHKSLNDLWPSYLSEGYFDAQGNLKVEYVSRERMELLVKAMCDGHGGLTTHQVRRYFGHCRAVETRLKSGGALWAQVLPEIKKLDVAAADGFAKKPSKIPRLFHDFIQWNVATIKDERDFLCGFLPHFEALVGFGTAHFRKERN